MTSWIPTRHRSEDGPIKGYVYLVVRDKTDFAVKIGSTRYTPSQRISQTKSCTQDAFLIACETRVARELEHYLHTVFTEAGQNLTAQDDFGLTAEDVLTVALWFDGGTFRHRQGGDNSTLVLVNGRGDEPRTLREMGELLGNAATTAVHAQHVRTTNAARAQQRLQDSLRNEWRARTAESWQIEVDQLNTLIVTGQLKEVSAHAWRYIDESRRAPIPRKPPWVDSYFIDVGIADLNQQPEYSPEPIP